MKEMINSSGVQSTTLNQNHIVLHLRAAQEELNPQLQDPYFLNANHPEVANIVNLDTPARNTLVGHLRNQYYANPQESSAIHEAPALFVADNSLV